MNSQNGSGNKYIYKSEFDVALDETLKALNKRKLQINKQMRALEASRIEAKKNPNGQRIAAAAAAAADSAANDTTRHNKTASEQESRVEEQAQSCG